MKINLPNPEEYLHKEDLFFEQLELSIYHAKKSWEKVKKQYDPNNKDDYPWLSFTLGIAADKKVADFLDQVDPDYDERQGISIEINEL